MRELLDEALQGLMTSVTSILAEHCASTAMIFLMHTCATQVTHVGDWHELAGSLGAAAMISFPRFLVSFARISISPAVPGRGRPAATADPASGIVSFRRG